MAGQSKRYGSRLYLASASPRRRALLEQIGLSPEVVSAEVDESRQPGEAPEDYVARMARTKALAGEAALGPDAAAGPVVGGDTAIALDGRVLGKPAGRDEGLAMLSALSGRSHEVFSAVAVAVNGRVSARVSETRVWLRQTTEAEREAYWRHGEPRDKAGAYAIQGLGALWVERLEGSYSAVVGLPLAETGCLLAEWGWAPLV